LDCFFFPEVISVPLSTSSFDRHLPILPWARILGVALLIFFSLVFFMEIRLAELGYNPTILDSPSKWANERTRASRLGERALILVGGSRIQLGVDLKVLRQETGLEPVQLAIDGSSFGPILAGLAADPAIRGTVLVDYGDNTVIDFAGAAVGYQRYYEKYGDSGTEYSPSARMEKVLGQALHEHFRSYADGASPFSSFLIRIVGNTKRRQYLTTLPDRSRIADYSLVDIPRFYNQRVIRNLGENWDPASPNIETLLAQKIAVLPPVDNQIFLRQTSIIRGFVSMIKARGGRVLFVVLPSSGLVREIEERRYPRELFWDRFVDKVGAPALRSVDSLTLKDFTCPDGSHLDLRDRSNFTQALSRALGLSRHAKIDK
jgi:hypothetical protein